MGNTAATHRLHSQGLGIDRWLRPVDIFLQIEVVAVLGVPHRLQMSHGKGGDESCQGKMSQLEALLMTHLAAPADKWWKSRYQVWHGRCMMTLASNPNLLLLCTLQPLPAS